MRGPRIVFSLSSVEAHHLTNQADLVFTSPRNWFLDRTAKHEVARKCANLRLAGVLEGACVWLARNYAETSPSVPPGPYCSNTTIPTRAMWAATSGSSALSWTIRLPTSQRWPFRPVVARVEAGVVEGAVDLEPVGAVDAAVLLLEGSIGRAWRLRGKNNPARALRRVGRGADKRDAAQTRPIRDRLKRILAPHRLASAAGG